MIIQAIALSGMHASLAAFNASASNVANMMTTGPVPSTPPTQSVRNSGGSGKSPTVYQPIDTITLSSAATGDGASGVSSETVDRLPSYQLAYGPNASFANAQGMIAVPNVDLANEMVNQMVAVNTYKANLAVLKTADEMEESTLDIMA